VKSVYQTDFMITNLRIKCKVQKSLGIIKDAYRKFGVENTAIAWTGGKDSTLILWMARKVSRKNNLHLPKVMFINEGDVFEEIKQFVRRMSGDWNFSYDIVQNDDVLKQVKKLGDTVYVSKLNSENRKELTKLKFSGQTFPFEPESLIGNHLMKTVAMNMYLRKHKIKALITGIRRDEQEARKNEVYFSVRVDPDHTRIHPLLHFREKDVWSAIHAYEIPFVELYYKGYRSLGAKSSTVKPSSIPAWKQDLKHTTERVGRRQDKEQIMAKLRKLGYM